MAATQDTCSPVDTMGTFYPLHQRSDAVNKLPPVKSLGIHEFYERIGMSPAEFVKGEEKATTGTFETVKVFADALEDILEELENNELIIGIRGSLALAGHPTSTFARPDVVIYRQEYSPPDKQHKVLWSAVEIAIEFHSTGKSYEKRWKQAITYALYLLEARPDLVSAVGLLVESDSLDFFFCNANEIRKLSLSKKEDFLPLLRATMKYLNEGQMKNCDSTLCREKLNNEILFNVSVPNGSTLTRYAGCSLRYSHDPFGRRPTVFIYDPKNGVTAIRVIKDQYIRKNRRWTEKDILEKIHADGTYPAVVTMCFFGEIAKARCGDRIRVRICLQDYGTDFLSLKTPREAIYALYDLLEGLYSNRKILHRDISPWNIMIRDWENIHDIEPCSSASPVFIRHLLDPEVPEHKSSIFLIDFGYSQDLDSSERRSEGRTGTPMFIARAVQAGRPVPSTKITYFLELPSLSEGIREVYKLKYPERMKLFNGAFTPQIGPSQNPLPPFFQHKLEHDGESGIWTFFWWCLLAFPENEADVRIDPTTWAALMPKYSSSRKGLPINDRRGAILHSFIDGENVLHPGYGILHDLFQNLTMAILPDYHWAERGTRQLPDFVHEILQRIILNFVVENMDAPFMDKKKSDKNRVVHGASSTPYLSALQADSSSASSQGRKRKLNKTNPDSMPPIPAMTDADKFSDNQSDGHDKPDDEDTQRFEKKSRTGDVPVINVQIE